MTVEEPRAVVERAREAFNAHDWEGFVRLLREDVLWNAPDLPKPIRGREDAAERPRAFAAAFPDLRVEVRNSLGQGEWVCEEWTFHGTHRGPLMGPGGNEVPATNKEIRLNESIVWRVSGGKIREIHVYFDRLELLAQLGLAP